MLKKRLQKKGLDEEQIKKVFLSKKEKYMYIDMDKEIPTITAAEDLKPLGGSKLWKMRHRKKIKQKNDRLERKGIFTY